MSFPASEPCLTVLRWLDDSGVGREHLSQVAGNDAAVRFDERLWLLDPCHCPLVAARNRPPYELRLSPHRMTKFSTSHSLCPYCFIMNLVVCAAPKRYRRRRGQIGWSTDLSEFRRDLMRRSPGSHDRPSEDYGAGDAAASRAQTQPRLMAVESSSGPCVLAALCAGDASREPCQFAGSRGPGTGFFFTPKGPPDVQAQGTTWTGLGVSFSGSRCQATARIDPPATRKLTPSRAVISLRGWGASPRRSPPCASALGGSPRQ